MARGIPFANRAGADVMATRNTAGAFMSEQTLGRASVTGGTWADGGVRRRQLRALLLAAADTARQVRRLARDGQAGARQMGNAVRDRVSLLLSAAG
jgi:hypothetical protein